MKNNQCHIFREHLRSQVLRWRGLLIATLLILPLCFLSKEAIAEEYLFLDKKDNELVIHYQLDNAKEIKIDDNLNNLVLKDKTILKSDNGQFQVTLQVKSEVSKDFYDPLRLYSNGEFLLYKDYLFPKEIMYEHGHIIDKENKSYPSIQILETKGNYFVGKRYVFWGDRGTIKIVGLNNQALKNKVYEVYNNVFSYYTKHFGKLSKKAPMVIIDFTEDGGDFYYKGDALDDLLSYNIQNVSKLEEKQHVLIYEFISHEIFHLWNSYEHPHSGQGWLHEGSAVYFETKSLVDLGYKNKTEADEEKNKYLSHCQNFYKDTKVKTMNENNIDYSKYICGNSVHILLEKLTDEETVINIWKEIFKGENYHSDDFYKKIEQDASINQKTKNIIKEFIYKKNGVIHTVEPML